MDVIPTTKLIFALVGFGFVFFFLNLALNMIITSLGLTDDGTYIIAAIWLFTNLPAVALFGSAMRYLMVQQKRTRG